MRQRWRDQLPLIHDAAACFGLHSILGGDVLGDELMLGGLAAEQRQARPPAKPEPERNEP